MQPESGSAAPRQGSGGETPRETSRSGGLRPESLAARSMTCPVCNGAGKDPRGGGCFACGGSGRCSGSRPDAPAACRCLHCGKPVHLDGDWWVDEDDDLTCEDADGNLGPHVGEKEAEPDGD